jgi:KAP family P-loop domain
VSSPAQDGLGHDGLAIAIAEHMETLPPGSVVAIQGPWGRGKTDVLRRVHSVLQERSGKDAPAPLWLNPWQYGSPNLIAPLVVQLLQRIPQAQRSGNVRLRRAAETLLRAGNAIAFKALSVVVPFGEVLQAGKGPIEDLIGELFDPKAGAAPVDVDPVKAMADRFRELVDEYLTRAEFCGPLVICVDDLDRCLPDHQIAMLEAIHFLTAADARAYFVVALDPTLVKQAAGAHYAGLGFDTNQYLDKLFDMRLNLRTIGSVALEELIQANLARELVVRDEAVSVEAVLSDFLHLDGDELRGILVRALYLLELANPRFIARVLDRLVLFARGELALHAGGEPFDATSAAALIRLLTMSERWPAIRATLQASDPEEWHSTLEYCALFCGWNPPSWVRKQLDEGKAELQGMHSLTSRLPDPERHPDVGQFLYETLVLGAETGKTLGELDRRLLALGL